MKSKGLLAAALAAGLLLLAGAWSLYVVLVKAPADLAAAMVGGVRQLLNVTPQVRIDQTVVVEQSAPIMELATVSRQVAVDYSWSHAWLGSTKAIRLKGAFTAKAGFNLREPFQVTIRRSPLRVEASLPPARLLSLTMDSYRVEQDEDGWWNKITPADREAAVRALQDGARAQVEAAGILEEARDGARERIRELVESNGAAVGFIGGGPATAAESP